MKILLPHINYTVHIRKLGKLPREVPNASAYSEHIDSHNAAIYLPTKYTPPQLAHEIIHILQYIANDRGIDFVHEQEHFGYLMQHILGRAMGYVWSR